mgnify:CR=1 FL=1
MKKRDSFVVYRSFYEATKNLPDEDFAAIYRAINEYGLNHKGIELSPQNRALFGLIQPQLEANYRKYQNGSKPKAKRKQNGSKSEANVNVNDNVNENVNVNDNGFAFNPFSLLRVKE